MLTIFILQDMWWRCQFLSFDYATIILSILLLLWVNIMPVITKITTQKNQRARFNIFIDSGSGEKFACGISDDTLVAFALSKGQEITEEQLREIEAAESVKKAYHMALHLLSFRMRTRQEIIDHLTTKDVTPAVQTEVIATLEEQQYIDDQAFADAFVRQRKNMSSKGPRVIGQELQQKGIDEPSATRALEAYSFDEQLQNANHLAEKQIVKYNRQSSRAMQQKIRQMLYSKGFPKEVIDAAMEDVEPDHSDEQEWENLLRQAEKAERKYRAHTGWTYQQKMKQHLYRKGFSLALIDRYLHET